MSFVIVTEATGSEGLSARLLKSDLEAKLARPKCTATGHLHKLSLLNNINHKNVLSHQKPLLDHPQQVLIWADYFSTFQLKNLINKTRKKPNRNDR